MAARRCRPTLSPLRRAYRQVRADLRRDPYLAPILLLATLLTTFWLHHRLPNFATRDERWRVVDVVEPLGFLVEDPRPVSVREGLVYWRSYGGTVYLYGVVLLPSLLLVAVSAGPATFADMAIHPRGRFWQHWLSTPGWVWTALVLPARLANATLAVGCVYLTYRLGVAVRGRPTGRLAALLLSLSWVLLVLAHEVGEDVPALFALLLSTVLALRYTDTGRTRTFYWACLWGGLAAGLKLTAGVAAAILGVAVVLDARRTSPASLRTVVRSRWRLLLTGAALGTVALLASYPSVLVGAPDQLGGRILRGADAKNDPHGWLVAPTWWWVVRGYLHGLGLPLAVAVLAGTVAAVRRIRSRGEVLLLVGAAAGLVAVLPWAYVRTHHLLPTIPFLLLLLAVGLRRLATRRPVVGRVAVALLVVSSAVYAGVGVAGYATQPRDRATAWLAADAPANATVETYVGDPQDAAVPHGVRVNHPGDAAATGRSREAWMLDMPDRCPDYIVLNYQRSLLFLAPPNHSQRAALLSYPPAAAFVRDLLAEDTYPYAVAGRFGPRPRFLDGDPPRPAWRALLRVGLDPRTIQYGDPQDFGVKGYTVVLKRTGPCEASGTPSQAVGANSRVVSKLPSATAAARAAASTSGTAPGYFRRK
jgi:hypothetical protein